MKHAAIGLATILTLAVGGAASVVTNWTVAQDAQVVQTVGPHSRGYEFLIQSGIDCFVQTHPTVAVSC